MPVMTVRTSYALDPGTADNIKRLARAWGVSQAEVIRRSIHRMAEQEGPAAMTPSEVVAHYASTEPFRSETDLASIASRLREDRHSDDRRRVQDGGGH